MNTTFQVIITEQTGESIDITINFPNENTVNKTVSSKGQAVNNIAGEIKAYYARNYL
jgi:hypothetical protein